MAWQVVGGAKPRVSTRKQRLVNGAMTCAHAVYVLLMLSLCTLVGALPAWVAVGVVCGVSGAVPVAMLICVLGAWLAFPALVAACTVCLDHPLLRVPGGRDDGERPWLAQSVVRADEDIAVLKPFARAYARVWRRALRVGAVFTGIATFGVWNLQILTQLRVGALLLPCVCMVLAIAVPALAIACVLTARYQKARVFAVVRNGFIFAVRAWVWSLLTLTVIGTYVLALLRMPLLALVLGTGLLVFVCTANATWQTRALHKALLDEEGDSVC